MGRSNTFTLSTGMQGDAEKHTGFTLGNVNIGNGINEINLKSSSEDLLLSAASSGQHDSISTMSGSRHNQSALGGLAALWSQLRANPLLAILVGAIVVLLLLALAVVTILRSRAEMFEQQTSSNERFQKGKF